jgi:hypothetical protein
MIAVAPAATSCFAAAAPPSIVKMVVHVSSSRSTPSTSAIAARKPAMRRCTGT